MVVKFPVPWEDLFASPNQIEWQYTEKMDNRLKPLNKTEVIYQWGDPKVVWQKHDEIQHFEHLVFVRWLGMTL